MEIAQPGSESAATWTFTVEPGLHRVSVTWPLRTGAASNTLFIVRADGQEVLRQRVDQRRAPDDLFVDDAAWKDLGTVQAEESIVVEIREDGADGLVFADAVRVERLIDAVMIGDDLSAQLAFWSAAEASENEHEREVDAAFEAMYG